MMKRLWPALVLLCLVACASDGGTGSDRVERPILVSDGRYAMGTVLELTLAASDERLGRSWIDKAFSDVAELEGIFSRYDPESDLSRLNAAAGAGMQQVDERLAELLALSLDYGSVTRGCFDISVAPLVELWLEAGASIVGGCCGLGPSYVRILAERLAS